MSRDKQIVEMAKDIKKCGCVCTCLECEYATLAEDDFACIDVKIAEGLYNAGYRKVVEQSETARECQEGVDNGFSSSVTESATRAKVAEEIFAEIEEIIDKYYNRHIFGVEDLSDVEQEAVMNFSDDITYDIAELKKKYTESEDT